MANIKPFSALRPQAQYAKQVASRPYDVMNRAEAKKEAEGNPYSFLHITRAEIDLPESVDIYDPLVYQKAKENLEAFTGREILFAEAKPCYYIYELTMKGRSQAGLVCVSAVDDYEKNIIKKHELTRPEKEKDRIDHMLAIKAHTGNVFLAYKNVKEIDGIIEKWKTEKKPAYDFDAEDGVRHNLWIVNNDQTIEEITALFAEKVPVTYIADGHHRAASAAKVRMSLADSPEATYFLTTLFPAAELQILDYNRAVKDLNDLTKEEFISALQEDFNITFSEEPYTPQSLHEFGMYLNGQWYILTARKGTYRTDPIGVLDVSILQQNILKTILDIKDPRTDDRIDFIGGIRGLAELEKRVDSGEMAVAFSLHPVTIQQLFDIADSGKIMPPKSTWFEPKLRDGLLTHLLY